jgi:hypothetical protein
MSKYFRKKKYFLSQVLHIWNISCIFAVEFEEHLAMVIFTASKECLMRLDIGFEAA